MAQHIRVLTTDRYSQPCIERYRKDGRGSSVFRHLPGHWKSDGLDPLRVLAREVVIGVLTDPSTGTIAQVFDSLQPSPKVDEFKGHLLRELRWAQRILNAGIKHLDPECKT